MTKSSYYYIGRNGVEITLECTTRAGVTTYILEIDESSKDFGDDKEAADKALDEAIGYNDAYEPWELEHGLV